MYSAEIGVERRGIAAADARPVSLRGTLTTVKVYTRHNRNCPKQDRSDWARCNCVKWLYINRDGKYNLVSAKTRSWERAEQKAREVRVSRSGSPSHGRIINVTLTSRGRTVVSRCHRVVLRIGEQMLSQLDPGSRERLAESLLQCSQALEKTG